MRLTIATLALLCTLTGALEYDPDRDYAEDMITAAATGDTDAGREAELAESQHRERAAVCKEQTINRGMDITGEYDFEANLLCPSCGAVVGDAECRELNGPYCHRCGQHLAIGPQEAGEVQG